MSKILLEASFETVDLRALFSGTPQEDNDAVNDTTDTGTENPTQEPTDKGTWKYEKALKDLEFSDDIISKLKALGKPFETILEVYGTQVNDKPTKGDNPILAFFKQSYVQENLLGKGLDANRFRAIYNALANKQVAHSEFWKVNDYDIIYCQDLYRKSPKEMAEYLKIQKASLNPSATGYLEADLLENRKVFFYIDTIKDQNAARRAKAIFDKGASYKPPKANEDTTKLNTLEFAKLASGKRSGNGVEPTTSLGDTGQDELIKKLEATNDAATYKYAAILSLALTTDSTEAKKALAKNLFGPLNDADVITAIKDLATKNIMPKGKLNQTDADSLVAKIVADETR